MNETGKKKILIIEDEKPLSHVLELKLTHEGFDVVATGSGAVGLQYLEEGHFDLVLTDLIIPGVDGFKVLETIQEKQMNVPVIVMTNLNQEEDKKRAFDSGASSFFVKSNSPISEIVASVKGIVPPDVVAVDPSQMQAQTFAPVAEQSVEQAQVYYDPTTAPVVEQPYVRDVVQVPVAESIPDVASAVSVETVPFTDPVDASLITEPVATPVSAPLTTPVTS